MEVFSKDYLRAPRALNLVAPLLNNISFEVVFFSAVRSNYPFGPINAHFHGHAVRRKNLGYTMHKRRFLYVAFRNL